MWMDVYLLETLMRERIAAAEERAAQRRLLRHIRSPRSRRNLWQLVWQVLGAQSNRPTKRLEEVTSP